MPPIDPVVATGVIRSECRCLNTIKSSTSGAKDEETCDPQLPGIGFRSGGRDMLCSSNGHDVARLGWQLVGDIRKNSGSKLLCPRHLNSAGRGFMDRSASKRDVGKSEMVAWWKHDDHRVGMGHLVQ